MAKIFRAMTPGCLKIPISISTHNVLNVKGSMVRDNGQPFGDLVGLMAEGQTDPIYKSTKPCRLKRSMSWQVTPIPGSWQITNGPLKRDD